MPPSGNTMMRRPRSASAARKGSRSGSPFGTAPTESRKSENGSPGRKNSPDAMERENAPHSW